MAVTDWIDEITRLWEVSDGKGGQVRSFRVFEKEEFPEALSTFPCAITYTEGVRDRYGQGVSVDLWRGVTEFHLTPDLNRRAFPNLMRFFARIRDAAAGNVTLNGKVSWFALRTEGGDSIEGPVKLQYGTENVHYGLVVRWEVKEMVMVAVE